MFAMQCPGDLSRAPVCVRNARVGIRASHSGTRTGQESGGPGQGKYREADWKQPRRQREEAAAQETACSSQASLSHAPVSQKCWSSPERSLPGRPEGMWGEIPTLAGTPQGSGCLRMKLLLRRKECSVLGAFKMRLRQPLTQSL